METYTKWTELLNQAVSEPGLILKAYSAFWGYSLGNRVAAMFQCSLRGIEPGPINTYPGWSSLGRQVKKGEKAIWLCMPLTRKKESDTGEKETVITNFVWKPRWFTLAQTEGEPIQTQTSPAWDKASALAALGITEIAFTLTDGNVQGYAQKRQVAISPIAAMPHKTLFHECAHICWLHSYALLPTQALWNEASIGFEPHITFLCIHPIVVYIDVAFRYPSLWERQQELSIGGRIGHWGVFYTTYR